MVAPKVRPSRALFITKTKERDIARELWCRRRWLSHARASVTPAAAVGPLNRKMAELHQAAGLARLLLLLLLLLGLERVAAGSLPEQDSAPRNYLEFGLDHEKICHPSSDKLERVADLKKYKDMAILVKPSHVFDSWQMRYSKHCRFKTKGPTGDGLFAVIQKMSFRRNGTECLDYVTFTPEEHIDSKKYIPTKYCGKIQVLNGVKRYIPSLDQYGIEILGLPEEFSSKGKIVTEIYISKQALKTGESLDLVITYTPYKDCSKIVGDKTDFWADPGSPSICINKKFVCDGYTNCANTLCSDENNCPTIVTRTIVSDEIGTKVTISAVTTMFLCFIIFVLCFWICRKHEILCWSQDCAGPTPAAGNADMPMNRGDQNIGNPPYVPTAPMLEVSVPSSVNDKDLPPSYDSLFPPQSTAAHT